MDPNQVLGTWETSAEYDLDANGKPVGSPRNAKTTVHNMLPFDALNYDAPNYAICCDLRADGGFLPVLNETVPMQRQSMVRKTRRMNHASAPKGSAGELSQPPLDTVPVGPPKAPNRLHGAPWTSSTKGGNFSQYPYVPDLGKGPSGSADSNAPPPLGPPMKAGAAPPQFSSFEYHADPLQKGPPPKTGYMKAGRGPEVFDKSVFAGPTASPTPKQKALKAMQLAPVSPIGKMNTSMRKNLQGTFGAYPPHHPEPFLDDPVPNPKCKVNSRGFWTCYTVSKPTIPILNVWDAAPLVKTRSGVRRDAATRDFTMTVQPYDPAVSAKMEAAAAKLAKTM